MAKNINKSAPSASLKPLLLDDCLGVFKRAFCEVDNSLFGKVGVVCSSFVGDLEPFFVGVLSNSKDGLRVFLVAVGGAFLSGVISCKTILFGDVFLFLVGESSMSSAS